MNDHTTLRYKVALFFFFAIGYAFFYVYPNFNPLETPRFLPLFVFETWIPLMPWTFFVYISDYLLVLTVIFYVSDLRQFNSFARLAFTVLVVSGLFFLFLPTTYPRPAYPTDQGFMVQALLNTMDAADRPTNCFPSMHVAITSIGTWVMGTANRKFFLPYTVWAIAIFISTLTTKQHYFLDIIGGLSVASSIILVEMLVFGRKFTLSPKKIINQT